MHLSSARAPRQVVFKLAQPIRRRPKLCCYKQPPPVVGPSLMFPVRQNLVDCEFLSIQEKLRPVLLLLLGMTLCWWWCREQQVVAPPAVLRWVYTFFNRRQFYDKIINDLISLPLFRFGFGVTTSLIDKGMIEVLVPVGLTNKNNSHATR